MRFSNGAAVLSSVLVAGVSAQSSSNSSALPVVDLGYELHQAAFFNVSNAVPVIEKKLAFEAMILRTS